MDGTLYLLLASIERMELVKERALALEADYEFLKMHS